LNVAEASGKVRELPLFEPPQMLRSPEFAKAGGAEKVREELRDVEAVTELEGAALAVPNADVELDAVLDKVPVESEEPEDEGLSVRVPVDSEELDDEPVPVALPVGLALPTAEAVPKSVEELLAVALALPAALPVALEVPEGVGEAPALAEVIAEEEVEPVALEDAVLKEVAVAVWVLVELSGSMVTRRTKPLLEEDALTEDVKFTR